MFLCILIASIYHINNPFPTVNNYHMSTIVQFSLPLNLSSSPAHSPPSLHSLHTLHPVIAQAHLSTPITTTRSTTTNPSPLSTTNSSSSSFSPGPGSSSSLSKSTSQPHSLASWVQELRSQASSHLSHETILTYIRMLQAGVYPDNFVFPAVLKAVAGLQDLDIGKQIHTHVVKFGHHSFQVTVANSLVNLYGKCNNTEDAYKVFERIVDKDQVSWNSMIAALCRFEEWTLALEAFRSMLLEGVEPSSFTLVSMANACSNLNRGEGLRLGKQVHAHSLRKGDWMTFTINALMTMYAKLGRLDESKNLFELFQDRNIVSWNTIISSFSQNDQFIEALNFLRAMVTQGVKPDGITISSVLPSCSHLEMLNLGKEIHAYAIKNTDLIENPFVGSALIDMYCNCKQVEKGRQIFGRAMQKTSAVWNAMITGYAQHEFDEEALTLFFAMENAADIKPNTTTLSCVLPACARCEVFHDKEAIHGYIIKRSLVKDRYVQNALMDMYSRIGKIEISRRIFNGLEDRDIVSWNTMITGYAVCGQYEDALNLFHDMQIKDEEEENENNNCSHNGFILQPNSVTLMAVLPCCAALTALAKGKEIHAYAVREILALDVAVGSALVDMYAKCGCLNLARRIFDQMPVKNTITWNILIMAYGMHGKGDEALELFNQMVSQAATNRDLKPNEVTYIAVFAACSHSGMVEKGLDLFQRMKYEHEVEPTADHYACIVDLLGRSGQVEKAYGLINVMPSGVDKTGAWCSLLGACRIHQNVDIGEIAAKQLFVLEPKESSHYVLLANIYSSAGFWDKADDVRKKMKEMGVKKEPGCSWLEFGDEIHKFLAGDMSHPHSKQLHVFLEQLSERMRKEGYVPDTSCVLHNLDDEEKEALLCGHSEKLAIAFGILNTPPGTTIRVAKNLRVCNDCHVATKFISKIMDREIILRDVRRFHHFRNGICSCGDYW